MLSKKPILNRYARSSDVVYSYFSVCGRASSRGFGTEEETNPQKQKPSVITAQHSPGWPCCWSLLSCEWCGCRWWNMRKTNNRSITETQQHLKEVTVESLSLALTSLLTSYIYITPHVWRTYCESKANSLREKWYFQRVSRHLKTFF